MCFLYIFLLLNVFLLIKKYFKKRTQIYLFFTSKNPWNKVYKFQELSTSFTFKQAYMEYPFVTCKKHPIFQTYVSIQLMCY